MKKISIIIAGSLLILLFFTGCEKLYRSSYTGKWDFVIVHNWGAYSESNSDTVYYLGKINLGATYNKLIIKYMDNTKMVMEVNECGELNKDYEDPHEFAFGQFYGNDNVEIKLGWRALGGGDSYSITGIKKGRR